MHLVYEHRGRQRAFELVDGRRMIGRDPDCDLCVDADGISKQHALLEVEGDFVELFDQQSRNGTLVNGRKVTTQILALGDMIQVGSLTFTLTQGAAAPPQPLAPSGETSRVDRGAPRAASSRRATAAPSSRSSAAAVAPPPAMLTSAASPLLGRYQLRRLDTGEVFVLVRNLETLGSREKNSIILTGEGVSRYHCKVEVHNGRWRVKDLDSRNGILYAPNLDSEPENVGEAELADGSVIQVGSIELAFEPRGAPSRPAPAPKLAAGEADDEPGGETQLKPIIGAAVALAVILIGAFLLLGGETPEPPPPGETAGAFASFEEAVVLAVEKVEAGDVEVAKRIMEKVELTFREQPAATPLKTVIELWNQRDDPFAFPWDRFIKSLEEVQSLNVPLPVDAFARAAEPEARKSAAAVAAITKAQTLIRKGKDLVNDRRVVEGCKSYYDALNALVTVPPKSSLEEQRRTLYKQTREAAFGTLYDEAKAREDQKDWPEALRFYDLAFAYAPDEEARKRLKGRLDFARQNLHDEGAYSRAVEIISNKDPRRYTQAFELLDTIRESSTIYKSAQAWRSWAEADLNARKATAAFRNGEGDAALELLDKVLNDPSVQPSVKQLLSKRRELWFDVTRKFSEGDQALEGGQFSAAMAAFKNVVDRVNDRDNVYHRLAEAKLMEIEKRQNLGPEELFAEAQAAINEGNYEVAYTLLSRLRAKAGPSSALMTRAVQLVDAAEQKNDIIRKARKSLFTKDRKAYPEILRAARLLKDFLPKGDKRAEQAADIYQELLRK